MYSHVIVIIDVASEKIVRTDSFKEAAAGSRFLV